MNRSDWLTDDLIEAAFERRADRTAPIGLRDEILTMTAATGQRAGWRVRLASSWSMPVLRPAWIVLLVLGVILGTVLALALVGQRTQRAHPGLLAYTLDGDVYLANPDGSGAAMVVHEGGVAFRELSWSPDDRWLALEGDGAVFVLDPATLALRQIAAGYGAVWSSDSRSLALVGSSASGAGAIEILDVGTGASRELQPKLDPARSVGSPLAWSPDGRWFLATARAGSGGQELVRIDATTGDAVKIAPMYHLSEPGAHWSPDSQRFAYARPDDCGGNPPCQSSVVIESADLSHVVAISDPTKLASNPVWSPDGAWIAIGSATLIPPARNPGPGPTVSAPMLSIVRADGSDLRNLVEMSGYYGPTFTWSADGSAVDFIATDRSTGLGLGVDEVRVNNGARRSVVEASVDGYAWQSIPADRTVPALPNLVSPTAPHASITPPQTPPVAPPADPSGSWSGLAADGDCQRDSVDFRTLQSRTVESRCQNSSGPMVFAPVGGSYGVAEVHGSVTVVLSDGSTTSVLGPLKPPSGTINELAWSPDARWLAVERCTNQGGDCLELEHVVVSARGGSVQLVPAMPAWTADGQRLVVEAPNGDLLVGSPDGSGLASIGTFPMPSSWSPGAAQFAFVRDGDAWIANADGSGARKAASLPSGHVSDAAWSPDGRFLAVVEESQLWVVTLDGGDLRPIDVGPGRPSLTSVSWSPDGARLAVVAATADTQLALLVTTDDWAETALGGAPIESLAWSPDGRYLALMDTSSTLAPVDIANADGSGRHTVWTVRDASRRISWLP